MGSENSFPPACERTLRILDYICEDSKGKTIKEISEFLDIPIASAYRLLNCMQEYGVIRSSRINKDHFKAGTTLSIWAGNSSEVSDLASIAKPYMIDLSQRTGQACQLCVLSNDSAVVIDQQLPRKGLAAIASLGEKIPVNISAGGKILAANLSSKRKQVFLSNASKLFRKETDKTLMDIDEFTKHIEKAKANGYGLDLEEYALGIGCIAVPIVGFNGKTVAALGLTGHISNYESPEGIKKLYSALRSACNKISQQLV